MHDFEYKDMPDDKVEISNLDAPDNQGKLSPLQRIVKFAEAHFSSRTRTTLFALALLISGCTFIYIFLSYLHTPIIQAKHPPTPTAVDKITISNGGTLENVPLNSLSVVNEVAYISTPDGTLSARQADNGATLWQTKTALPLLPPIVVDDTIYNVSENSRNGHIDAFRASDGNLQWSYQTQLLASQPVMVEDGIIYVCTQTGTIYALRASDGILLWHFSVGHSTSMIPLRLETFLSTGSGVTIIRTTNQTFYFLRSRDGSQLWHYAADVGTPPPDLENGIAYIDYHSIQAHRLSDGKLLWQYTADNVQSLTIQHGIMYLNIGNTTVLALNAQNGKRQWQFQTGHQIDTLDTQNGMLFATMLDGTVVALQNQTGSLLWQFKPPTQNDYFWISNTKDDVLYIGLNASTTAFYALQSNNGHVLWQQSMHTIDQRYPPRITDSLIYARQTDGHSMIWRRNDGHLIWHSPSSTSIIGDFIEENGFAYLQQSDGSILALSIRDGKVAWRDPSSTNP